MWQRKLSLCFKFFLSICVGTLPIMANMVCTPLDLVWGPRIFTAWSPLASIGTARLNSKDDGRSIQYNQHKVDFVRYSEGCAQHSTERVEGNPESKLVAVQSMDQPKGIRPERSTNQVRIALNVNAMRILRLVECHRIAPATKLSDFRLTLWLLLSRQCAYWAWSATS